MGRDLRRPSDISLPELYKFAHSWMCRNAVSLSLFCMACAASAQTPGSPENLGNALRKSPPQICDGQESGEQNHLSLKRNSSAADGAQMSQLQTDPAAAQSDEATDRANSRDSVATQQKPLQCLRAHPKQRAETSSRGVDSVAPVAPPSPRITFSGGTLTVDPHNAPLGDVLSAIRKIAGFELDVPRSGMDTKIFDKVGPLPIREALVQLLYGSGFNYIIQTAPDNPQDVTHVFVSTRMGKGEEMAGAARQQTEVGEVPEDEALYGGFADPSLQEQPIVQPGVAVQTPPPNAGNVPGVPAGFNLKQAAAEANKTPAQILDELQKRQLEILDAQSPPQ